MKIWAIEQKSEAGWWPVELNQTRQECRDEIEVYRRMYKSDEFRVRAYQRVEGSK